MQPDLNQLGNELRHARLTLELSEAEAARRAGLSVPDLQALESGHLPAPPLEALLELNRLYDLDYPRLLQLAGHVKSSA